MARSTAFLLLRFSSMCAVMRPSIERTRPCCACFSNADVTRGDNHGPWRSRCTTARLRTPTRGRSRWNCCRRALEHTRPLTSSKRGTSWRVLQAPITCRSTSSGRTARAEAARVAVAVMAGGRAQTSQEGSSQR
eukprot:scaffold55507_cov73-Phaeocystis_antarctica.AAC.3